MDEKDVEKVVLRAVAERIGQDRFDVWFGNSIDLQLRGDRLEVSAPSRFYADRLAAKFGEEVAAAATAVSGDHCTVVYKVVDPPKSPPVTGSHAPNVAKSELAQPGQPSESPDSRERQPSPHDAATRKRRPFRSLSTFVTGPCNRLAFTGVRSATENPGDFSPLLLWGPPGTGKTHLLEGIWTALRKQRDWHVLYVTAEQFTTMFLSALHGRGLPSFRQKFRTVDVLLIDDVQFFAKKRATLVELQHTVDALNRAGKQLVMTSDRAPTDLTGLGKELMTRLSGGLVCNVQLPDEETRRGIVGRFLTEVEATLSPADPTTPRTTPTQRQEVIRAIAQRIPGDARQLRGAVNQAVATARAHGRPLSVSLVRQALAPIAAQVRQSVGLEEIEQAVCEVFGLKPHTLQSDKRSKNVSHPRMLAMWLARKHTPAVYAEIGDYFGNRSHSTVIAAQKKVRQWLETDTTVNLGGADQRVTEALQQVESRLRLA